MKTNILYAILFVITSLGSNLLKAQVTPHMRKLVEGQREANRAANQLQSGLYGKEKVSLNSGLGKKGNKQRLDFINHEEYDSSGRFYYISFRDSIHYNSIGQVTAIERFYYSTIQDKWFKQKKLVYGYNSSNQLASVDFLTLNKQNGEYDPYVRNEYFYDLKGNITTQLFFMWENDQWVNTVKDVFEFDLSGRKTLNISYSDNLYGDSARREFSYNTKGDMSLMQRLWVYNGQWRAFEMDEHYYETNIGLNYHCITKYNNFVGINAWVPWKKIELFGDEFKNDQIAISSTYDTTSKIWSQREQVEFVYDHDYNAEKITWPEYLSFIDDDILFAVAAAQKHLLKVAYFYDIIGTTYYKDKKFVYGYSPVNETGNDELNLIETPVIYPNPTHGKVSISSNIRKICRVELYDLTGKQIQVFETEPGNLTMELSGLHNGIYIARLTDDHGAVSNVRIEFIE